MWFCKCDCGNEIDVVGSYLVKGDTKSCGCLNKRMHKDLTGMIFGKWLVKEYIGKKENSNHHYWLCECQCEKKTNRAVREYSLLKGETYSCGCELAKNFEKYYEENNMNHGMTNTRFYRIWGIMKRRCYDKNFDSYPYYGEKGIEVCERWKNNFINFKNDMYEKYINHANTYGEENTTIDRIDVTGNYEPSNCRWATMKEQQNNKNNTIYLKFKGEIKSLSNWCDEFNIPYARVAQRYEKGFCINDVFYKGKFNSHYRKEHNEEIKSI